MEQLDRYTRTPIQEKKIFSFEQAGVYLSNEFQGARLNDVIKKNDTCFIISILPENHRGFRF